MSDNKNNHYELLIKRSLEVLKSKDRKKIEEVLSELTEELKLPYIPKKYEEEILKLHEKCAHFFLKEEARDALYDAENNGPVMTVDQIKRQLKAPTSTDRLTTAINIISTFNISMFMKEIEEFLKSDGDDFYIQKTLILEELMKQKQYKTYVVKKHEEDHVVVIMDGFSVYSEDLINVMKEVEEYEGYTDQVKEIALNFSTILWFEEFPRVTLFEQHKTAAKMILDIATKSLENEDLKEELLDTQVSPRRNNEV